MGKHNLQYQYNRALDRQCRYRSSKKEARKASGKRNPDGIYGIGTMRDYKRCTGYYVNYLDAMHPGIKTMAAALKYIPEYIQYLIACGLAASTIALYVAALKKAHGLGLDDIPPLPPRRRDDITRSRCVAVRDAEFSEASHQDLVDVCRGTGCRREDIENNVRAGGFYTAPSGTLYMSIVGGKGGLDRQSPVLPSQRATVERVVAAAIARDGSDATLFEKVSGKADIHGYRRDYVQELYRLCAEDHAYRDMLYDEMSVEQHKKKGTAKSDRYYCRESAAGISYDRMSLQVVAVALGHGAGRESTVVNNYLLDTLALPNR